MGGGKERGRAKLMWVELELVTRKEPAVSFLGALRNRADTTHLCRGVERSSLGVVRASAKIEAHTYFLLLLLGFRATD